jgi:hypothetical protein
MGYTHYWQRQPVIDNEQFNAIVRDFRKALPVLGRAGVELAGPLGDGKPVVTGEAISFNGRADCSHGARHMGVAWPAEGASGVAAGGSDGDGQAGSWAGGRLLGSRSCGGDCSHESFCLPRIVSTARADDQEHPVSDFCKTAFKPYDLAVQVCLVIARHHLGGSIKVASDGDLECWRDAMARRDQPVSADPRLRRQLRSRLGRSRPMRGLARTWFPQERPDVDDLDSGR